MNGKDASSMGKGGFKRVRRNAGMSFRMDHGHMDVSKRIGYITL